MSESPSLFGTPREWATDLAIATAIGVFLGMIGPFGSFNGGPAELRIAYWVANMWIGFIVLSTTVRASIRVGTRLDLPVWFTLAVGVAIGALPLGYLVGWFSTWFWPGNHGRMTPILIQYGQTLVISWPCAFGYYFLADRGWRNATNTSAPVGAAPSSPATGETSGGFLERLPPRLGRELLCLQMEDHYVRAHTAKGSDLILTAMKDAIAELGDTDGLQVHRSWWVARRAVAEPVAQGRSYALRLTNGLDVPVSRASVAKLRAAGWLGPAGP